MTITPEQIAAFVDDELDGSARAQVAQAALREPELAARIAAERQLRDTLRTHFDAQLQAPVPEDWIATIRNATAQTNVISLDQARGRQRGWVARGWVGTAIAASLVIGVLIGSQSHRQDVIVTGKGDLLAANTLAHTLDTQLASAQTDKPVQILGTFRRQGGDVCRVFAAPAMSGIACNTPGGWHLQHITPGTSESTTSYRQAGSAQADLMASAQAMATGDPLSADQERHAQQNGWH